MLSRQIRFLLLILCFTIGVLQAQTQGTFGIRGGVGTDISGGIAYGGAINYQFPLTPNWLEIGPVLYISHFEETTEEYHTYEETTDLTVFGVLANMLFNYNQNSAGTFFLAGFGFAAISVEWEEKSETDISLGTPLPGGGSMQSAEGTAGGSVINVGVGYKFQGNMDIRAELPVILIFDAPGEAGSVAPTLTVTVGFRF